MAEGRVKAGLVLTGGGARAAYQVGVLRALSEILPPEVRTPFPIICGTSAGAVNAAVMAANGSDFRRGVRQLMTVWKNFRAYHVYRADPVGVFRNTAHWIMAVLAGGGLGKRTAVSLLDNEPLGDLLRNRLDFSTIQSAIDAGDLIAVSVTCSGYSSGQSVTFFQGVPGLEPWHRARRIGIPMPINPDHLLASSALPFVFPAVRINREYFGDGSMRQIAPVSPALHLGADRLLIVGVGRQLQKPPERTNTDGYPRSRRSPAIA
jgi:NTE family protein